MATKPTNLLANLPNELTITKVVQHSSFNEIYAVYGEYPRMCPHCGSSSCVIKDSGSDISVYHTPCSSKSTHLIFHRRRYLCHDCGRSFMEQPEWLHPSLHVTRMLYLDICLDLTKMLSLSEIASRNGVTEEIVSSVLSMIRFSRPSRLPEILCMDEFKGDTGIYNPLKHRWDKEKFHASVIDGSSHAVIDILPGIRAVEMKKYFRQFSTEERSRVKFFCCDMHNGFIGTAKEMFPQCTICIDRFHVIKHLNEDAIDAVRCRLQNSPSVSQDEHRILKNSMRILRIKESTLSARFGSDEAGIRNKLDSVLRAFPDLSVAYDAVQEFHCICDNSSYAMQRLLLTEWLDRYSSSEVPEVAAAAKMVRHWRGYIMNALKYGISNGISEGFNNRIKVLKRTSYGLHDFDSLRRRILLICGYTHHAGSPETLFTKNTSGKGGSVL